MAFTVGLTICSVLTAAILDSFVLRPQVGGGSITTLLPGFVYACATVMKVCLASALFAGLTILALLAFRSTSAVSRPRMPVWGIASIVLPPLTPLIGALVVILAQRLILRSDVTASGHFPSLSRGAVFVMLAMLLVGGLASIASLLRRELPKFLPVFGFIANTALIGLFWYLQFYAPGFDQDNWAPR